MSTMPIVLALSLWDVSNLNITKEVIQREGEKKKETSYSQSGYSQFCLYTVYAIIFRQKEKKNTVHKQYSILTIEQVLYTRLCVRPHLIVRKSGQLCGIYLCAATSHYIYIRKYIWYQTENIALSFLSFFCAQKMLILYIRRNLVGYTTEIEKKELVRTYSILYHCFDNQLIQRVNNSV